ncbi:hypothetical protein KMZ93_10340 [Bradyrhizobium sediminis]|uniref:Uncharacterized protein n=1 Tax=Bradyrhizobium sediminis TaxID=2840469 RepID=A0A975P336_9BRAD|nr:hypothetical protein [Bradyrhizobium sediminis]QWG25239.1 hypothetical protein KMZ93_10340 [Bradyrhizobium sediminis]
MVFDLLQSGREFFKALHQTFLLAALLAFISAGLLAVSPGASLIYRNADQMFLGDHNILAGRAI